jgi:ATP-dependent Clp protease ATP-binding subunit ClpA
VDFKNTVVIMTSNIGSAAIAATGARAGDAAYEAMKRDVTETLSAHFRPEFLNRVDEVIVFHALTEADLERIVELLLAELGRRLEGQDLGLELTPAARALIVREGTDPAFGARPLKRTIQRLVENPLARALVSGEFKPGDRITADADLGSGTIVFSSEGATVVTEGGTRRDARRRAGADEGTPVGAGSGRASPFDLPPTERKRDDGDLVN